MVSEVALSFDLAIILLAATIAGFLARQTGQPTIIAYIIAGVIIGPVVLGLVEVTELTETLSELGLAFLLFLLGIKMRIDEIKHILSPIVKISLPQMAAVAAVGTGVSLALGFGTMESIIIGLAVMYSSTAVVIKMLTDLGETTTLHGKIDVGILLLQDVVVVIILAVLAAGRPESAAEVGTTLAVVLTLVAIITVAALAASKYALPPIFRRIADNKQIFFLIAISWAFLFVFVSDNVNLFLAPLGITAYLSIEMGAFLAGVAIAQLPYSKELQDRVNPLTDLFVMIFFASVALSLDAGELFFYWQEAVIAAVVLMIGKFVIFFALISWQRFDSETTFFGSLYMIQVSEFGVVVATAAVVGDFIGVEILGFLTLVALITMGVSVYFFAYGGALYERAQPSLSRFEAEETFAEEKREYTDHAVVVGYDDLTRNVLELLDDHYDDLVVVDRQAAHVTQLTQKGYDAVFGDIGSGSIRKDIALKKADFVLSSSDQIEIGKTILRETSQDATVILEAGDDEDARALYDRGADYVIQSVPLSSERLADYLEALLEDPDTFEDAAERDVELLKDPQPFRDVHERMRGDLDE
ncbi:Kef-type K+ transport system, membrane component [Halalkaliarchaeum desulfuricum]|uniref:Kef-type K+ transport system, membrane component n=1 Tax=Halalkaliarchaeum desulfuricum TaxID=2055893 RepID=A0A343THX6_9EURY|nr:cation:proton antiporter [Halalkaliarchaeum desulfuricum]AUX08698.1 Kef-type K+ transport system, membrane component [Halalkaliarchaeum desulfuricum]